MKNIILLFGMLVTNFSVAQDLASGLSVGSDCPAFDPQHVSGPDRNSHACPMCKYGSQQGVMIWVNDSDWKALTAIVTRMESEIESRGLRKFRVFVMYMNPEQKSLSAVREESAAFAKRLDLRQVAFTYTPGPTDAETAKLYDINPAREVKNTVLVYKKRRVVDKVINLDAAGLDDFMATCNRLLGSSF